MANLTSLTSFFAGIVFCMPPSQVSHRVNRGGALRKFGLATLLGPITGRASVSFNSKLLLGHTLRKVNIDLGLFKNGISLKIAWRKWLWPRRFWGFAKNCRSLSLGNHPLGDSWVVSPLRCFLWPWKSLLFIQIRNKDERSMGYEAHQIYVYHLFMLIHWGWYLSIGFYPHQISCIIMLYPSIQKRILPIGCHVGCPEKCRCHDPLSLDFDWDSMEIFLSSAQTKNGLYGR
jgi:hypothetical protein